MAKERVRRPIRRFSSAQKTELIQIGQLMSNVLYSMKQHSEIPETWRKIAEELQTQWDAIKVKP